MGAGKPMLDCCLLDHRSWFAPSNSCSKPEMRALEDLKIGVRRKIVCTNYKELKYIK